MVFIQHNGTEEEGLSPNTKGWNIISSLDVSEGDSIIKKTTNDSFYKTQLDSYLAAIGAKSRIIFGWATNFCADTTVRSAISHEYFVTVAADCHTVSNRPHLTAERVIEHHNWLWGDLITTNRSVQVTKEYPLCL